MSKYEIEVTRSIWPADETPDEFLQVAPDADGLECVELSLVNRADKKVLSRIVMPPEQALVAAKAIHDCANELIAASKEGK